MSETIDRLQSLATAKGLLIFSRIDHAHNAREVGLTLRPTELLLFGNPRGGTPLMQDQQIAGLDLPVRALAWEDERGQTWLSYYSGSAIAARHGLNATSRLAVEAIDKGMEMLCHLAATQDVAQDVDAK
ncbi:MAG TPA: DUF302 domain-containing protein [Gemmatimonadaceae bacterium]|nr:DUF302 domain-containing protein [Gemmatimonadaceae bacterium]